MGRRETGVRRLDNGHWEYRFSIVRDGKTISMRRRKDPAGEPFLTMKAASRARQKEIERLSFLDVPEEEKRPRKTFAEVYDEYCERGRGAKAYATIKKQDSLWRNHIKARFAERYIDDVSSAEIVDYLTMLYYEENRAYSYVESFLKMFYLIFGQAYTRNYLGVGLYSKLCLNKGTKIHMPPRKRDEDDDIKFFSKQQMEKIEEHFRDSNAETAFLLGRFCGLRINECYGLKWENINLKEGTILIDRQMQYQEGLIKLVPLKTRNAKRVLYMPDVLKVYLQKLKQQQREYEATLSKLRQQNHTMIMDLNGKMISSLLLVNTLPNGKIQTINSMKYHSRTIKEMYGIDFKFHYLRHTYGTLLAEMNTPAHLLRNQMGHANTNVTQKYYIALSKTGIDILCENLNRL